MCSKLNDMKVYNNVDDKVIFESNSETELIDFVNAIRIENEDFDFSIIGMADCVEYVEDYCSNLKLIGSFNRTLTKIN